MAAVENATDDGTLDAFPSEDDNETEPDDCDCDGLGGFPCWPCVTNGTERTAELTTTSVLFLHDTPIDALGHHRPTNAPGEVL